MSVVVALAVATTVTVAGARAFAQPSKQDALVRLEQLESQRAQEEYRLQAGQGLSPSLRDGYAKLRTDYSNVPDITDWADYRLAEYDYSRDQFASALHQLSVLADRHKGSAVALEAELLAAKILESPYNPARDVSAAEAMLSHAEQESPGNARTRVAHAARQAARALGQSDFKAAGDVLTPKLAAASFLTQNPADGPIDRAIKSKQNEEAARANRLMAFAQAGRGDFAGAYATLGQVVLAYTGDNPRDYFTLTTTLQDLEYQKAVALAAFGKKSEAIAELKAFAAKYPDSHLALRAQARIEQLDPHPTAVPKPAPVQTSSSGTLSAQNACICGPSALRVALSKLNHEVPLATLIQASGATQDGTTMAGLLAAAKAQGVQGFGLHVAPSDLRQVQLPALLLLHDHYVTVTAVSGDNVTLFDPLIGWVTQSQTELDALWEGNLLVFAPTEAEALQRLSGAHILSSDELSALKGRYLCGNMGGNYPGCNAPCANFQPADQPGDGDLDGISLEVNRVNGNHLLSTPPLLMDGIDNSHIAFRLTYNSEASTTDSSVGPGWAPTFSDHLIALNPNVQWVTSDGSRLTFTRNVDGTFTAPPGNFDTMRQNADGTSTVLRQNLDQLRFDATGRLISQVDRNGLGVTLSYDAQGRLGTITDTSGVAATLTYGTNGKVASVAAGTDQVNFTYDGANNLTQIAFPGNKSLGFSYSSGFVTALTDTHGKQTTFAYNSYGQITSKTNALGKSMVYNSAIVDYAGASSTYTWDTLGRITAATDPLGNSVHYEYTPDNKLSATTDPLGNRTQYYYDARGNRTTAVDALSNKTLYTYDSNNQVTSVTDALGRVTAYTYDSHGNLLSVTDQLGNTMKYTYDAQGHLTSVTDFAGATTSYAYDSHGWLSKTTDALGHATAYGYDALGRRTSVTDAQGNATNFAYDFYGHVTQITYPDKTTESMQFDGQRLVAKTDRRGNTTRFAYDDLGHLTTLTDAKGAATQFAYDAAGRQTSITDALSHATSKTYDVKGRLTKVVYPGGLTETYTYDADDHLISKSSPDGTTTTYTYDALGRVVRMARQ